MYRHEVGVRDVELELYMKMMGGRLEQRNRIMGRVRELEGELEMQMIDKVGSERLGRKKEEFLSHKLEAEYLDYKTEVQTLCFSDYGKILALI